MIAKIRALDAISHENHLVEIYQLEPERMNVLIDIALAHTDPDNRWVAYETLKKFVTCFVGMYATRDELRTAAHYEVILAFIDWLLPSGMEDREDMEDAS